MKLDLLVVLSLLSTVVEAEVTVEVGLLEYRYLLAKHCDDVFLFTQQKCDPFFKVCLNESSVSCESNQVTTSAIYDRNYLKDIIHNKEIKPNPISFHFVVLPKTLTLQVEIWNENTLLDNRIDTAVWTYHGYEHVHKNFTLTGQNSSASVMIYVIIRCDKGFYGKTCREQCSPALYGHCDSNGTLICEAGYSGKDCTVTPIAELPTPTAELPTPTADSPTPTAELPTPTAELPTPTADPPKPTAELPTPTAELPTPTAEPPTPTADPPTPTPELPTPTAELPTPATELPTPTAEPLTSTAESPTTSNTLAPSTKQTTKLSQETTIEDTSPGYSSAVPSSDGFSISTETTVTMNVTEVNPSKATKNPLSTYPSPKTVTSTANRQKSSTQTVKPSTKLISSKMTLSTNNKLYTKTSASSANPHSKQISVKPQTISPSGQNGKPANSQAAKKGSVVPLALGITGGVVLVAGILAAFIFIKRRRRAFTDVVDDETLTDDSHVPVSGSLHLQLDKVQPEKSAVLGDRQTGTDNPTYGVVNVDSDP